MKTRSSRELQSVSVIDVAARAGVSLGTVSNVLNRPDRVAPATRERVLQAIDELGFVRNEAARQLRAGRSRTIGLVVLDVGNPFFTDIAAGVESAAAEPGCRSCCATAARTCARAALPERARRATRLRHPGQPRSAGKDAQLRAIRRRGIPVVLVDRGSGRRQCSVSVDDVVGGELAVAHLIECGHRDIAFVGGPISIKQVTDRLEGARRPLRAARLSENRISVIETSALNVSAGRSAGERIAAMSARRRPTAAFCANDLSRWACCRT